MARDLESSVLVDFRKWPDRPHWRFTVHPLGRDNYGSWLHLPKGSTIQRADKPPVVQESRSVMLIPDGEAWWVAFWNADRGSPFQLYIDICSPPEWSERRVRMIDLDLDVARDWEGVPAILDEDEFAEHQKVYGYPEPLVSGARAAADRLFRQVDEYREPFDKLGPGWLAQAP